MTTTRHPATPAPDEHARRNTTLLHHSIETGFWDQHQIPTPWPDDIDPWRQVTYEPITPEPGQPPFSPKKPEGSAVTPLHGT